MRDALGDAALTVRLVTTADDRIAHAPPVLVGGLVVLFGGMIAATWAGWGHPRIDCGGVLDRAALLAQGAVLYRDAQSPYGPVADYVLAGLFRVFGIHLTVAYGLGIALLAGESVLLWVVCRRFLARWECAAGLVAFWLIDGVQPGLFNWVLPYTFAATFGTLFATATLALTIRHADGGMDRDLVGASLCAAAAGLSKVEFGAAAVGSLLVGGVVLGSDRRSRLARLALAVLPGLALSIVVMAAVLCAVPWRELVFDNLFRVRSFNRIFPAMLATLRPVPYLAITRNFALGYGQAAVQAALLAGTLAVGRWGGPWRWAAPALAVLVAAGFLALGWLPLHEFHWTVFAWTPLAWLCVAIVGLPVVMRRASPAGHALVPIAVFSVLILLRWRLRLVWPSYAGVFAPFLGVLLLRTLLLPVARHLAGPAVALVIATHLVAMGHWLRLVYVAEAVTLDYPRGRIRTFEFEGRPLRETIDYLRANSVASDPVEVLPEERLITFLAERRHATRETGIGPGWLATPEDERDFVHRLEAAGTKLIVLSNRTYVEMHAGGVASYNPIVMRHIEETYDREWTSGGRFVTYTVYRHKP